MSLCFRGILFVFLSSYRYFQSINLTVPMRVGFFLLLELSVQAEYVWAASPHGSAEPTKSCTCVDSRLNTAPNHGVTPGAEDSTSAGGTRVEWLNARPVDILDIPVARMKEERKSDTSTQSDASTQWSSSDLADSSHLDSSDLKASNSEDSGDMHLRPVLQKRSSTNRNVLRRLVASLCEGCLTYEDAEIALQALEAFLDTDGVTLKGYDLLFAVLNELAHESSVKRRRRAQCPPWRLETWLALDREVELSLTEILYLFDEQVDRYSWGGGSPFDRAVASLAHAVHLAVEEVLRVQLGQVITAIRSDPIDDSDLPIASERVDVHYGAVRTDAGVGTGSVFEPHHSQAPLGPYLTDIEKRAALSALVIRFYSFWHKRYLSFLRHPLLFLRTEKARDQFEVILNMLHSDSKLRLQIQSMERAERSFAACFAVWKDVFDSPEFDLLYKDEWREQRESDQKSCTYRQTVFHNACGRILQSVPAESGQVTHEAEACHIVFVFK